MMPHAALLATLVLATAATHGAAPDAAGQCIGNGDFSELKPAVAESLSMARQRLMEKLADPATPLPVAAAAFGELGQNYHVQLLFAQARSCYLAAIERDPEQVRAHYYLGYLHQQQSRLEPAARSFSEVLALKPGHPWAALRLAQVRLEQERPGQARVLMTPFMDHPEFGAWVHFQLGRIALANGDYADAVDLLQTALKQSPQADRIHYPLAMAWRGLGDREQARAHLTRRGEVEPQFSDPLVVTLERLSVGQGQLYIKAMEQIRHQAYADAVATFREALAGDPDNPDARVSLARALFLAGDATAARQELETVTATAPRALASFLLGALHEAGGDTRQSTRLYRQALQLDPAHGGAHFLLARHLTADGRFADAASHFRRARELVPDNTPARLWEILTSVQAGADEQQLADALRAAQLEFPADPAFAYYRARLLCLATDRAVRDPNSALELAHRLQAEHPDPAHLALTAIAQAATGDVELAAGLMSNAVSEAERLGWNPTPFVEQLEQLKRDGIVQAAALPLPAVPPIDAVRLFRDYPSTDPY